jgi:hypothetical protein
MSIKYLTLLGVITVSAQAGDCVLQDKTVSRTQVTIQERADLRRAVVPDVSGGKKCTVEFRAKINNEWHPAHGEVTWDGNRPSTEMCAQAVQQAERDVRDRVSKKLIVTDSVMICSDNADADLLKKTAPGMIGKASQFRPHPSYPERFWHNGVQCRWFIEPAWDKDHLRQYQGVVCELSTSEWVVVDRF